MPEYDAGTVKATMTADSSGVHAGVERVKKDYKDLAQAIADAMRTVKKEESEANKVERERQRELQETARKAREAAQIEKQAAQERKEAYRDLGLAAGVSFTAITAAIWKSTQVNNQLKASMAGLDSVATGNIGSYEKIKQELQQIQADGLIPLTNATQAYKNLISRYQDEDTAIKMFHKIADAAAFGRQAHLSLGEAIQGTSEGLKNEMSNMTDNGGITKNLSLMWKDYAAQIGKTVGKLTEAEKRQAEVNGFMEEGRFQTGDLAKLQQQLGGQMAKASAETTMAAAAFGDALEPAMTEVVMGFSGLMKGVREFIQSNPGLVAGITTAALATTGLVAATSAWIALDIGKKIAAGFTALTGPVGISLIALSALAGVMVGLATAEAKAREENDKLINSTKDEVRNANSLITEYQSLSTKTNKTTAEKQKLHDISQKIAKALPDSVTGYNKEGDAIIDVNLALINMIALKKKELDLLAKKLDFDIKNLENQNKSLKQEKQQIEEAEKRSQSYTKGKMTAEQQRIAEEDYTKTIDKKTAAITKNQDAIDALKEKQKALREESKSVTVESIRKELQIETKTSGTEPNSTDTETEKERRRQEKQKELKLKLEAETLERLGMMREAAVRDEEIRYQDELKIAKGNKALLEQVEISHKERLLAIEIDSIKQREGLEADLTLAKKKEILARLQAELQALQTIQGVDQQYLEAMKKTIADLSLEVAKESKSSADQIKQNTADMVTDLVTKTQSFDDIWKSLMNEMVKDFIYMVLGLKKESGPMTQIFDGLFSGGEGGDGGFFGNLISGIGGFFGFNKGGMVPDYIPMAAQGMIVPSFAGSGSGSDTVPAMLTPKEMVLDKDISSFIVGAVNQAKGGGGGSQIRDVHFHINAIDGENAYKFMYQNKDLIVGIVYGDINSGGILRNAGNK